MSLSNLCLSIILFSLLASTRADPIIWNYYVSNNGTDVVGCGFNTTDQPCKSLGFAFSTAFWQVNIGSVNILRLNVLSQVFDSGNETLLYGSANIQRYPEVVIATTNGDLLTVQPTNFTISYHKGVVTFDNVASNNSAFTIDGGKVRFTSCNFASLRFFRAIRGADVYLQNSIVGHSAPIEVFGGEVIILDSWFYGGLHGALRLQVSDLYVNNGSFVECNDTAIQVGVASNNITIRNSSMSRNRNGYFGPLWIYRMANDPNVIEVTDTRISDNYALYSAAIRSEAPEVVLKRTEITTNYALHYSVQNASAVSIDKGSPLKWENVTVSFNYYGTSDTKDFSVDKQISFYEGSLSKCTCNTCEDCQGRVCSMNTTSCLCLGGPEAYPCEHGSCTVNSQNFVCNCEDGWEGETCSVESKKHHKKPSRVTVVIIVTVGCIVVAVLAVAGTFFFWRRRRSQYDVVR